MAKQIRTKFFIISDTHGEEFPLLDAEFDVATHCGDLTEESKPMEFERSLKLLGNIQAPLKLVIAGKHDFTPDPPMFKKHKWQVGDADVVVTHDPPRGVSDTISGGERAGDPGLFAAVAQSRPKLHCFGHMAPMLGS